MTVRIARPYRQEVGGSVVSLLVHDVAIRRVSRSVRVADIWAYLGIGEDMRRNDLVGTKGLPRVDERGQDLAALLALRYSHPTLYQSLRIG